MRRASARSLGYQAGVRHEHGRDSCMAVFPIHFLLVALGIPTAATSGDAAGRRAPGGAPLAKQLIRHEPCAAQLRTDFTRLRS